MSDLRDQLRERLHDVFMHGPEKTTMWGDVADEVIRQMEWAWAMGHDRELHDREDLCLAPEDWKP